MKKLWIALLSAMVVFAIAMPASAVDVKFSGVYHVWGVFDKNHSLIDDGASQNWGSGGATRNGSAAGGSLMTGYGAAGLTMPAIPGALDNTGSQTFYQQRLRIQTEFKVVEGLTLVTRFDALEKKWGDRRWGGGVVGSASVDSASRNQDAGLAVKAQENIEFERAYVDFNTGIGKFLVGYQNFIAFGTLFGDSFGTRPGIKYIAPIGPVTIIAAIEKAYEENGGRPTSQTATFHTDADADVYDLGVIWKGQTVEAGVIWQYARNAANRPDTAGAGIAGIGTLSNTHVIDPYIKATFGPVYIEGELAYVRGKQTFDDPWRANAALTTVLGTAVTVTDVDLEGMGIYLGARVDLQPVYFGLQFAWIRGDDPATTDKKEGGFMEGMIAGQAYNPALMMFNDDFHTWVGDRGSAAYRGALPTNYASALYPGAAPSIKYSLDTFMDNVWFYHIYVGVKPVPKADVKLAFSYAYADKKPWANAPALGISTLGGVINTGNPASEFNSNKYGYELDLTASYKIYDNLEYMVGAGYFWPGDYFKGCYNSTQAGCYNFEPALANDYLLMHKLTLSF